MQSYSFASTLLRFLCRLHIAIRGLTGQIIDVRDPQVHEQQCEGHALGVAAPVADSKGNDAKANAVHQLALQGKGAGNVVGSHEHSAEQQASLNEKTSLLATQQKKIDNIIGVKADVIEALQKEFSKNNVSVDIDAQTGALTLNANVLFDYDKSELTDEGKQELADILPIYCKVLLQKDYKKYLAEIIIDGYTDTDGDYDYNLELSQKRSLAVAQYLTEIRENFLSSDEISELQNYLTVNGHGSANPVLDSDGNVDKDASRRVEVKFRLKDDEMINELNQIMNTDKTSDSEKSGSN